jgi:hypothetical protein
VKEGNRSKKGKGRGKKKGGAASRQKKMNERKSERKN